MSNIGDIEFCDGCHHVKRIQFILIGKTTRSLYCSQACMKDHISSTLFHENEDWASTIWIPKKVNK